MGILGKLKSVVEDKAFKLINLFMFDIYIKILKETKID